MMNRILILAGIATLGAFMGSLQPKANASPVPTTIVLDEVVIYASEASDGGR